MVSKIESKNWFRRHWIISIFLGLILIGMFSTLFNNIVGNNEDTSENLTGNVVNEQVQQITEPIQEEVKTCISDWSCGSWSECGSSGVQRRTCKDYNNCGTNSGKPSETQTCIYKEYDLEMSMGEIFDMFDGLSEIQQEEKIKVFKGKRIKTSIYVSKIDKASLSSQYVAMEMYLYPYSLSPYAKVFFPSEEKDKLLKANIGDILVFSGELVTYHEGALTSYIEFTNSKVIEIKQSS